MHTVQTFRPSPKSGRNLPQLWISPSTNQVIKHAKEMEDWGIETLRTFNRELALDLLKLNQDKKQIVQHKKENKVPKPEYRHDLARIDKRRNFLLMLQTRVLRIIDKHKVIEREEDRKLYVVCLREACQELLSPEQCETVYKVALSKYQERNPKR